MSRFLIVALIAAAAGAGGTREAAVRLARERLAADRQVPEKRIVTVSAEERQWPDAALGCPLPGRQYAQVVTHGYRVVLLLADQQVVYHVAGAQVVPCPDHGVEAKGDVSTPAVEGLRRARRARDDLARRLGLRPGAVRIAVFSPARARETGTCGEAELGPGDVYDVELDAEGRGYYRYRVGPSALAFCGRTTSR